MKVNATFQKIKWILLTAGLAVLSSLFFSYIKEWLSIDVGNAATINQQIHMNPWQLLSPLLIAPIIEEWIFRKKLPTFFQKKLSKKEAILFSNGIFAIVHLDWFFIPYFVNGCLYSICYEKTKDIKASIFSHILYNVFVFIVSNH